MSSQSEQEKNKTEKSIDVLQNKVKKLYEYRDFYLLKRPLEDALRKDDDVKKELQETLKIFDELADKAQNEDKSRFFYLKGRALNVTQEHDQEAEKLLSKALKLNTNLLEAWNELGFCMWKRGDSLGAKKCFLKNPKDKVALRSLAIVLRQQPSTTNDEKIKIIEESLAKATESVELDPSDGLSWVVLGNSYLVSFFSILQSPKKMKQALAAYLQAEKDVIAQVDPDLFYNKGIALQYQEEFLPALESFSKASSLDPTWDLPKKKEKKLLTYLETAQHLVSTHGKQRPKKLHTMLKGLSLKHLGPYEENAVSSGEGKVSFTLVALKDLEEGLNKDKVILGKVVSGLHSEDSVAFSFCITDKNETCVVVTVYNLAEGRGFIIGDSVAIPDPYVSKVCFHYKDKTFDFNSIRVATPLVLAVNGRRLSREHHACTTVSTQVSSAAQSGPSS
ncbi:tetratricopeptide repeat protein 5-like [Neocloeon triangulifer]|uniref:tetratricopeptide repeat protein 5-like n=1 Tax=Neocloeon triangulifer TaxID=2078957 RepID=UPI00286FAC38|nr:tetratricopeptide repeat protein 5-like [Neocloeon triangulifer]